jgi:hypothetical protein
MYCSSQDCATQESILMDLSVLSHQQVFFVDRNRLEVVFLADGYYHHRNVQSRCWQCRVRMSLGSRAGKYHLPVLLLGGNICRFDIRMLHVLCRHIFCRECNYVCCLSLCQPGVRRRRLVSGANDGIGWTEFPAELCLQACYSWNTQPLYLLELDHMFRRC